jgi:hypothetical protein
MSPAGPAQKSAQRFRAFHLRVGTFQGPIIGAIIFFILEDRFGATGV